MRWTAAIFFMMTMATRDAMSQCADAAIRATDGPAPAWWAKQLIDARARAEKAEVGR